MRKRISMLVFVAISTIGFAQDGYKRTGKFDQYNKDWALVQTISGTYGFIGRDNKIVVQPVYSKIQKFAEYSGKYALVKSVAGSYGFIDRNGKEVVPAIYWTKNEATEQLKTLEK